MGIFKKIFWLLLVCAKFEWISDKARAREQQQQHEKPRFTANRHSEWVVVYVHKQSGAISFEFSRCVEKKKKKLIIREIVCLNRALKQWPGACCNFIFRSRSVQLPLNYQHLFLLLLLLVQLKIQAHWIYMCIWVKRANNRSVISRCTQMGREKKKTECYMKCIIYIWVTICAFVWVYARWLFHSAHPYLLLTIRGHRTGTMHTLKTNFYIHSCDLVLF